MRQALCTYPRVNTFKREVLPQAPSPLCIVLAVKLQRPVMMRLTAERACAGPFLNLHRAAYLSCARGAILSNQIVVETGYLEYWQLITL